MISKVVFVKGALHKLLIKCSSPVLIRKLFSQRGISLSRNQLVLKRIKSILEY